jgi:hypothetical protein
LWLGVSGKGDVIDDVVPQCPWIGWKCGWQATYWGLLKSTGLSKNGAQRFPADALCQRWGVLGIWGRQPWLMSFELWLYTSCVCHRLWK